MVLPYPGTDVPGTNARHSVGTIKGEGTDESEHEHQGLVGAMFERVVRSTILLSSVIPIILTGCSRTAVPVRARYVLIHPS